MNQYLIDGNNVIGKVKNLKKKKDKQQSREQLAMRLDGYFSQKRAKATLYFDGHPNGAINTSFVTIRYSYDAIADECIKRDISNNKNPKKLIVVSSDHSIENFARACSCNTMKSESFSKMIMNNDLGNEEEKRIAEMKHNIDEFKRLFGVDDE